MTPGTHPYGIGLRGSTDDGRWHIENGEPHSGLLMQDGITVTSAIILCDPISKERLAMVLCDAAAGRLDVRFALIFDQGNRGRGMYGRLLESLREHFTIRSDAHYNNSAKRTYLKLGADDDGTRFTLRQRPAQRQCADTAHVTPKRRP